MGITPVYGRSERLAEEPLAPEAGSYPRRRPPGQHANGLILNSESILFVFTLC